MKNLVNCSPREFLTQTIKIKRAVEKWLTDTDIMTIRKRMPVLPKGITAEEREAAIEKQARENLSAIFDVIAEEHPDETVDLLALMCFVDPDDANNHKMSEYLIAVSEMIQSEAVMDFFTSLLKLANSDIFNLLKT